MELRNLTPHAVALVREDGETVLLDGTREPARLLTTPGCKLGEAAGVALHAPSRFECIVNLPERQEGVVLLVSQMTALAIAGLHPDRDDIVYPGTGHNEGAVRDGAGVLSVHRLVMVT